MYIVYTVIFHLIHYYTIHSNSISNFKLKTNNGDIGDIEFVFSYSFGTPK